MSAAWSATPDFCASALLALESALHLRQGLAEGVREALALRRREVAGDDEALATRDERQLLQAEILVVLAVESRPQRIESPFALLAAMAHPPEREFQRRQHQLLEGL